MVTNLSKKMITEWGMSEKLGRLRYNSDSEEVFLGHSVAQSKNLSDSTAKLIDEEVRSLAEEMIFGKDKITNGAASDIQMVTNLSKKMITEWGMSEKLGRLRYNSDSEEVFLGHSVAQSKNLSDSTAKLIDEEVRSLAEEAENNCRKILQDNIEELHIVAKGLLEYETLSGDEIKDLIKGIKPTRDDFDNDINTPKKPATSVPKTGGSAPAPAN